MENLIYGKIAEEDINQGHGTFSATLPDGSTGTLNKVGIQTFLGDGYLAAADFSGATWLAQIGAAIDALPATGGVVDARGLSNATTGLSLTITKYNVIILMPPLEMTMTGTITVNANGVYFIGVNEFASTIKFNPSSAGTPAIKFILGASTITDIGVMDIGFSSSTTVLKAGAIHVVDGAEVCIRNVYIASTWTGGGNTSTGILIEGRQTILLDRITNFADLPFHLKDSPNTSLVSIDQLHASNIYSIAHSTQPNWLIASDVFMTNCTWDGYQAWVDGTYGMYWNASAAGTRSYNVHIENARWEQSTNATGYMLYLNPKAFSTALNVTNCYSDSNHKGYYVRNFVSGIFGGNRYEGVTEAFNAESSSSFAVIGNHLNINAGATVSTTGFDGIWLNNDGPGSGIANSRLGLGVMNPTNQCVVPNAKAFAGLTAGGVEKRIAMVEASFGHVGFDLDAAGAYFAGTVTAPGDLSTNGNAFVTTNNNNFAALTTGGAAKGLIGLDTSNRVRIGEGGIGVAAYTNCTSFSFGGAAQSGNSLFRGAGTPEGSVTGVPGDLYVSTNGGANTTLYVKESGTGNTGWIAK